MKADFHVHTNRSVDGVHSPRVMVKCAKAAGLDAVAITDHNRLFPWSEAQRLSREFRILVIPGIEGGDIAVQKHWLALGIAEKPRDWSITRILARIRNEAGLSIAPHPHTRLGFDNYAMLGFDAVEALNATEPEANRMLDNATGVPEVACSDAHAKIMLGTAWTEVGSEGPAEDVLEAVRHGLCKPCGTVLDHFDLVRFYYLYFQDRVLFHPVDTFRAVKKVIRDIRTVRALEARPATVTMGRELP